MLGRVGKVKGCAVKTGEGEEMRSKGECCGC